MAVESEPDAVVPTLTADTFEAAAYKGIWFVMFHAPWCGHCKRLKPLFGKLAAAPELQAGDGMRLALVDCTADKPLCERHGAKGYPTFRYFVDGQMFDYKGVRELAAWRDFSKRLLQPQITKLDDDKAVTEFTDAQSKQVNVVWVLSKQAQAGDLVAAVQRRAAGFPNLRFGRCGPAVARRALPLGLSAEAPALVLYNDVLHRVYAGDWAPEPIGDWLEAHRFLMVEDLDHTNFYALGHQNKRMAILICDSTTIQDYNFGRAELQRLATLPLAAHFAFGRLDGAVWASWVTKFGLPAAQFPYFFVFDAALELYFRNDTHAALIQQSLLGGDGLAVPLMEDYLGRVLDGRQPESALGLKGHLNRVTRALFPSMLGYLEEMQMALLLSPVLLLGVGGLVAFCCLGRGDDDEAALKKLE